MQPLAVMRRVCARPLCDAPAARTMSYDYRGRVVYVDELAAERHPASYDLCTLHTSTLAPPRGWVLAADSSGSLAAPVAASVGGRTVRSPSVAAAGVPQAQHRPAPDGRGANRPEAYLRRAR